MSQSRSASFMYRALKFARRPRGPISRACFAAVAWVTTFAFTGRSVLAEEMRRALWTDADLILPIRRLVFYARRGWLGMSFIRGDAIFDFTQELSPIELKALSSMISTPSDRAVLAARSLSDAPDDAKRHSVFVDAANDLLRTVKLPTSHSPTRKKRAKRSLDQAESAETLRDLASAMPTDEVPWFVLSGTLLGMVRENRFLPHDDDIDIGLLTDGVDIDAILNRFAELENFAVYKLDSQPPYPGSGLLQPRPMVLKLVHRTGVRVELFLHYKLNDAEVVLGTSVHHWVNSPFDLASYELAGVPVLGPSDADRHLTENYGAWKTPVTDFNCTTSTPNMRFVRHPLSIVAFLRRLAVEAEVHDPGAVKLAEELKQAGIIRALPASVDKFELVPALFEN